MLRCAIRQKFFLIDFIYPHILGLASLSVSWLCLGFFFWQSTTNLPVTASVDLLCTGGLLQVGLLQGGLLQEKPHVASPKLLPLEYFKQQSHVMALFRDTMAIFMVYVVHSEVYFHNHN